MCIPFCPSPRLRSRKFAPSSSFLFLFKKKKNRFFASSFALVSPYHHQTTNLFGWLNKDKSNRLEYPPSRSQFHVLSCNYNIVCVRARVCYSSVHFFPRSVHFLSRCSPALSQNNCPPRVRPALPSPWLHTHKAPTHPFCGFQKKEKKRKKIVLKQCAVAELSVNSHVCVWEAISLSSSIKASYNLKVGKKKKGLNKNHTERFLVQEKVLSGLFLVKREICAVETVLLLFFFFFLLICLKFAFFFPAPKLIGSLYISWLTWKYFFLITDISLKNIVGHFVIVCLPSLAKTLTTTTKFESVQGNITLYTIPNKWSFIRYKFFMGNSQRRVPKLKKQDRKLGENS